MFPEKEQGFSKNNQGYKAQQHPQSRWRSPFRIAGCLLADTPFHGRLPLCVDSELQYEGNRFAHECPSWPLCSSQIDQKTFTILVTLESWPPEWGCEGPGDNDYTRLTEDVSWPAQLEIFCSG